MLKRCVLSAALLACTPLAAKPIVIQGHTLGETVPQFLELIQRPNAISQCQSFLGEKHPKAKDFVFGPKEGDDPLFEAKRCREIIKASAGEPSSFIWVRVGTALFNHGNLVGIELNFVNSLATFDKQVSYLTVLADAVAKLGTPTEEGSTDWQNGFGAQIHPHYANWMLPDVIANVRESPEFKGDGYQPDITFSVMLKNEAEALRQILQERNPHTNVLDSK